MRHTYRSPTNRVHTRPAVLFRRYFLRWTSEFPAESSFRVLKTNGNSRGTHGHRRTSSPPPSVFASQMSDRPRSPSTPSTSLSSRHSHMTSLGTGLDRVADTTTAHSPTDGRLGNRPDNRQRSTPSAWFTPTKSCRLFPTMTGTFSSQQWSRLWDDTASLAAKHRAHKQHKHQWEPCR